MTVHNVKSKLCFHCGTPPSAMELQLKDPAGKLLAVLGDESRKLGYYSPTDGCILHIIDSDPTSLSANGWLEDTSKVGERRRRLQRAGTVVHRTCRCALLPHTGFALLMVGLLSRT